MSTVLITGGTGFFGRHLAQALKVSHRVVLGARNNRQNSEAAEGTGCEVRPLDVANIESVRDLVAAVRPAIIIHAAATKYVDLSELEPMECLDVNVGGSQNVARVAVEKGVQTVLGISTDKAAPPVTNTYGLTKALMERLYCSMNGKTDTRFTCVRFGNLAWSTGSVFPTWQRMIEREGVIRSTGPGMRRFIFAVDEAVALVEAALANLDLVEGRVLTRRMKAAQISDILEVWTRSRGGSWVPIEERPGDAVDQLLVGESECPFTREVTISGVPHYLIGFRERIVDGIRQPISSASAERLTEEEILQLITPPREVGIGID